MTKLRFDRPYDDPYKVLAWHLVSVLSVRSLKRVLTNNLFIKSMVLNEANQLDISGPFLDCIDEEIAHKEHLRSKNKQLKSLGEYYFSELDLERLRVEVRAYAEEMGVVLD